MALSKVTFFDNTNFKLDESITDKECKDFVTADDTTTLSYNGIYFTPKYDETKTDINTVHHIAHNGHIYTLGSDVIKENNEDIKVTVDIDNSIIPIISSLEADRFEKIIKYTNLSIDFSNILNRLSELERIVYGPEPTIDSLPNIVLYYIKYDGDNPSIVDNETYADIKPETLTPEDYDNNNANKILLTETYFNQYTKDTYSDNANYILKHNNGDDITIDSNDNRYDVIGIGLDTETYKITNICLPDENNNKYGREISIDTNVNVITIDNKQIIKILDKQDTGIRISAIVYNEKNQ